MPQDRLPAGQAILGIFALSAASWAAVASVVAGVVVLAVLLLR